MAKVVIAGRADCPYFAKAELLGDKLASNLPDFNFHKIVKQPEEWTHWLYDTCTRKGWAHSKSPLVWRELVDRGGKGILIGGANEFQEYVCGYYGEQSQLYSDDMRKIAKENEQTKIELDEEERLWKAQSQPVNICITNAAHPVCYSIIRELGNGECLGNDKEISLRLLDHEDKKELVEGAKMEAFDLACPLVRHIEATSDRTQAFKDASIILLVDDMSFKEDESTENKLRLYYDVYKEYSKLIDSVASPSCKVLVFSNGATNFITRVIIENSQRLSPHNILGVSQAVENRAKACLANRLKVNSAGIHNIIIWGNINGTHVIDPTHSTVGRYDGAIWGPDDYTRDLPELIANDRWLAGDFLTEVEERLTTTENSLKHTASNSQASALATTLRNLQMGPSMDEKFSMGVLSSGQYNVPEGVVCSLPVRFTGDGSWEIIPDLPLNENQKNTFSSSIEELMAEWEVLFPQPGRVKSPTDTEEVLGTQEKEPRPTESLSPDTAAEPVTSIPEHKAPSATLDRIEEESTVDDSEPVPADDGNTKHENNNHTDDADEDQ